MKKSKEAIIVIEEMLEDLDRLALPSKVAELVSTLRTTAAVTIKKLALVKDVKKSTYLKAVSNSWSDITWEGPVENFARNNGFLNDREG